MSEGMLERAKHFFTGATAEEVPKTDASGGGGDKLPPEVTLAMPAEEPRREPAVARGEQPAEAINIEAEPETDADDAQEDREAA